MASQAAWINIFVILSVVSLCLGNKTEDETCKLKFLSQDVQPMTTDPPYVIQAATVPNEGGVEYSVSVSSLQGKYFKAFLLQARDADKDKILGGSFSTGSNTKRLDCGPYTNNSLVLANMEKTDQVNSTWTPPSDFKGNVEFWATVAEEPNVYWTNLKTTPNEDTPLPETMAEARQGCGQKRTCFGYPRGCLENPDDSCQNLVSFIKTSEGVSFRITGQTSDTLSWFAVGLSDDRKMGDDSVTDCILLDSGEVVVQQSWNYKSPKHNEVLPNPREGIQKMKGRFVNGTLTCSWTRKLSTYIHDTTFDLVKEKWYLLLARGPIVDGVKRKHHGAIASENEFNLTGNPQSNGDQLTRMDFERILKEKQRVINNYRKHFTVFQEKLERAKKTVLSAVRTLNEMADLLPEDFTNSGLGNQHQVASQRDFNNRGENRVFNEVAREDEVGNENSSRQLKNITSKKFLREKVKN